MSMHFDGKHLASLILILLLLCVEPVFCSDLLTQKSSDLSSIPPVLRSSHKDLLLSDFKSLLESAQKGDVDAQEKVGLAYCDGIGVAQDYSQALIWLQKAADQKNVSAISRLGLMYANGWGVSPDPAKAFQYYLTAATTGNEASDKVEVAERYAQGNGVAQSPVESLDWYSKAAAQNNAEGETRAGMAYFNGEGATKDPQRAFGYFLRAAYQDAPRAQYYLAYFYWNGIFVQRDPVQAYKWIELATTRNQDDDESILLGEITSSLTTEQRTKGAALIWDWPMERRGEVIVPVHGTFQSGTSATVPFENIEGQIVITTTINEHDKLKFMLDTGAATSMIDGISVSQYKIPTSSTYSSLSGIGKQVVLGNQTDDLTVALPGLTFDHVCMSIAPGRPRIDGVLGYDMLSNYVIKINYIAKTVTFMAPESFDAANAGQLLPCSFSHSKIWVNGKINNNNSESNFEQFVLDTGCYDGFVLSQHYTLSYPLLAFTKGRESHAVGVGGDIWAESVSCFAAQLGDTLLKEPIVTVVKHDQGAFLRLNGIIGNKIWQNFDLTIDYPGKRLYLKPNANFTGGSATAIAPPVPAAQPRGPD